MRRVWWITLAHTALDFYMTLAPPLYAVFKSHFGLTLVQTSFIPTFVVFCGSITQPLIGYFSDRRNRLALTGLGLLVCGVFVSTIGFAPAAWVLVCLLVAASLGSSLFHPTAGGLVTGLVPGRSNFTMAVFLTGGTLGMAIAPVTGTQIVEHFGLESLWVCVFPALVVSGGMLLSARGYQEPVEPSSGPALNRSLLRTREMRPLWTLYGISVLRSLIHTSFVGFIAVLGEGRGWSTSRIGWVFSGYLICSTLGRLTGGLLADRLSARKLLAFSNASSGVLHIGFCALAGIYGIPVFLVAGYLFDLGITTNIVLAQRLLPRKTSTATGLVMGFSWGTAGLLIPLVGKLAEGTSVAFALGVVSCALFPAALLVGALPSSRPARPAPEAELAETSQPV